MDGIYASMAKFYDRLNAGLDYSAWADFAEEMIKKHSKIPCELILDAACGTGSMTIELSGRGYDMTGVDLSPDMLNVARERAEAAGLSEKILFLCQDLGELDLYGTVDACVCCLDSVNHITDPEALYSFFDRLHRCFLTPGGVLIFDINTPYKFENVYANNDFVLEDEGMYCGWQSALDPEEGMAYFYLSLFEEGEDGRYMRTDMEQCERVYTMADMKRMLSECGFDIVGIYSDYDMTEHTDEDERWYFVCVNREK